MSEAVKKRRQFGVMRLVDAAQYRLPLAGYVSILHRISGLLLFLLLPFILYLLGKSLGSEASFIELKEILSCLSSKLVILALSWAFLHHFSAGVRHLFMDFHFGLEKDSGRHTSIGVFVVSLSLTAVVAAKMFEVF